MRIGLLIHSSRHRKVSWVLKHLCLMSGHDVVDSLPQADVLIHYGEGDSLIRDLNKLIIRIPAVREEEAWNSLPDFKGFNMVNELAFPKTQENIQFESIWVNGKMEWSFNPIPYLFYWFSNAFYMDRKERDSYGRLTFSLSGFSEKDIEQPHVQNWSSFLDKCLKEADKIQPTLYYRKHFWPGGAKAAVAFSHDVDIVDKSKTKYWKAFLGALIRRDCVFPDVIRGIFTEIADFAKGQKGRFMNFQLRRIALHHRDSKIKASFNIIASTAGGNDNTPYLYDYKQAIKELDDAGHEIGIHGGFDSGSYRDATVFNAEKESIENIIGHSVNSVRQHYLGFDERKTFAIVAQAGIKIDTSVGYPDAPGFKCGVALPYNVWDFQADQEIQLKQLPLILMDGAIFSKAYSGMSGSKAEVRFQSVLESVKHIEGVLTVNYHQRVFSGGPFAKWMKLYSRIVKVVNDQELFVDTTSNITDRYQGILDLEINRKPQGFEVRSLGKPISRVCLTFRGHADVEPKFGMVEYLPEKNLSRVTLNQVTQAPLTISIKEVKVA